MRILLSDNIGSINLLFSFPCQHAGCRSSFHLVRTSRRRGFNKAATFDPAITITWVIIALGSAFHQVQEDTGGYSNIPFGWISFLHIGVGCILPGDNLEESLVSVAINCLDAVDFSLLDKHGALQATLLDLDSSRLSTGNDQSNGCEEIVPRKIHDLREILGMCILCSALQMAIGLEGIHYVTSSQFASSSETLWQQRHEPPQRHRAANPLERALPLQLELPPSGAEIPHGLLPATLVLDSV